MVSPFQLPSKYQSCKKNLPKMDQDLKVSTTTVYDIYKNRNKIDADLFFEKLEKIAINCIPIVYESHVSGLN